MPVIDEELEKTHAKEERKLRFVEYVKEQKAAGKKGVENGCLQTEGYRDFFGPAEFTGGRMFGYWILPADKNGKALLFKDKKAAKALSWCKRQYDQAKQASYCWFFDRQLPGDNCGAWHSSDLWYWFGTLENGWRPWEQKDRDLTDLMVRYLTNFAKNGNPNGDGLPRWNCVDGTNRTAIRLGEGDVRMENPKVTKLIKTMLTNKAVGE